MAANRPWRTLKNNASVPCQMPWSAFCRKEEKMFICEKCAPKADVSEFELLFAPRSYGPCEYYGEVASCVDSQRRQPTREQIENAPSCFVKGTEDKEEEK